MKTLLQNQRYFHDKANKSILIGNKRYHPDGMVNETSCDLEYCISNQCVGGCVPEVTLIQAYRILGWPFFLDVKSGDKFLAKALLEFWFSMGITWQTGSHAIKELDKKSFRLNYVGGNTITFSRHSSTKDEGCIHLNLMTDWNQIQKFSEELIRHQPIIFVAGYVVIPVDRKEVKIGCQSIKIKAIKKVADCFMIIEAGGVNIPDAVSFGYAGRAAAMGTNPSGACSGREDKGHLAGAKPTGREDP